LDIRKRLTHAWLRLKTDRRLARLNHSVITHSRPDKGQHPVAFFNASSRLGGLSLNAAFTQLTAWGVQLAGTPVVHFACQSGMSRCVLGTNPDDHTAAPPCEICIRRTKKLTASASVHWFDYRPDARITAEIENLNLLELSNYQYSIDDSQSSINDRVISLGKLVLPSLRWALRRHYLPDDHAARHQLRQYILSAYNVALEFAAFLANYNPETVVLFNGLQFPEATARWVARQHGIRTITHEVSFQPFSAFFTAGEATAYPIDIPADFELTAAQNALLDAYLSQRFKGEFTMAGIRFWPQMSGLDDDFLELASSFQQIVPVFTNVIFDTSQVHANTVFPDMFAWLELVFDVIRRHPETLFVIRAHPDEKRPGTRKQSRESVSDWLLQHGAEQLPNVVFFDAQDYVSSYDLIRRAKFVMIYNSSIGLEATLLDTPVLCGGQARFTQYPTVFFPPTADDYRRQTENYLTIEHIEIPAEFKYNSRRFLYYQLFRVSLPFDEFIEPHPTPGYVQLKRFPWQALNTKHSQTMRKIVNGIVEGKPFLMPDKDSQ
jgi:hypothetical protein